MSAMRLVARGGCPVCGGHDSKLFMEARFDQARLTAASFASRKTPEPIHARLVECSGCDVVYADPVIDAADLAVAYAKASFDSQEEAQHASRTYAQLVETIVSRLPDRDGAVDIGAGEGSFLRELVALGFRDVIGIEPSRAPVDGAAPDVRPLLRCETFRPGSLPAASASVVTCFQTLEHLPDPLLACKEAFRVLKPGGALVLVDHDRRALSARVLGERSPIIDIEHLQLFSKRSLQALLGTAGFGSIEVAPISNRYPLKYWARLLPLPARLKEGAFRSTGIGRRLGDVMIPLRAGNIAGVGYKPNR